MCTFCMSLRGSVLDCEQFLLFPPVIVYRARKCRPRGERGERRTGSSYIGIFNGIRIPVLFVLYVGFRRVGEKGGREEV